MLNRLWAYVTKQLVADAPNDIAACLDCDAIDCPDATLAACPVRVARAAALNRWDLEHRPQGLPADGRASR